ncbi:glucose-6-phosphate isomerase [Aurantiacibacter flavus]|uniref:Glucose-6-phosphate isomerase n=1 Tax=Aurantiacibacter flavus TaxID=3145232 RepID=A0ABV0CTT0_9SPHN
MSTTREECWNALAQLPQPTLAELFAADEARVEKLTRRIELDDGGIRFDWSKTHLDDARIEGFEALAKASDFDEMRRRLFAGEVVNPTEERAAEHSALRGVGKDSSVEEAEALRARMLMLVQAIHDGVLGEVRHLIHVGIGGSALGPALAVDALAREDALVDVHVVANIDGLALEEAFAKCDPATTLVAVASKTFTTIETMTNAQSALRWLADNGVDDPTGRVIALTAAPEKAVEWGVDETRILPFATSVGGRYSMWSSIGFPIALAIGVEGFEQFLAGAAAMDRHFESAEDSDNLPLRAAFADLHYARILRAQTRAVFAYDERLRMLPDYLQQLEMESNGKSVTVGGEPAEITAPITWGGVGTDAQHAVFQLLHQGTHLVPVDFIASIEPGDALDPAHHHILLMNCFAQGAALMAGKSNDDPHRNYPGNRPSATILLDDVTPESFGALIAFHEHRVFAAAVLMDINPFDQFGVELGKEIAKKIEAGGERFDPSTEALLKAAALS